MAAPPPMASVGGRDEIDLRPRLQLAGRARDDARHRIQRQTGPQRSWVNQRSPPWSCVITAVDGGKVGVKTHDFHHLA